MRSFLSALRLGGGVEAVDRPTPIDSHGSGGGGLSTALVQSKTLRGEPAKCGVIGASRHNLVFGGSEGSGPWCSHTHRRRGSGEAGPFSPAAQGP